MSKPQWLKISPPTTEKYSEIKSTLKSLKLTTVCEESHCPNIAECWSSGTATFMVMGDTCTRACKFCNVKTGMPGKELDPLEPVKLALAINKWGLDYIVITSVDRDDLRDQGSNHFASCIKAIRRKNKYTTVEVLIPDFRGDKYCLKTIINAKPDVIAHNVETVERLQGKVRDIRANYKQSLGVLENIKKFNDKIYTKSSIMLGLGEKKEEVIQTMKDLRKINVDVFTLGQYLRPSQKHLEVREYVSPEEFDEYKRIGEELGFIYVASGPFVRSSYKASELFLKGLIRKEGEYEKGVKEV